LFGFGSDKTLPPKPKPILFLLTTHVSHISHKLADKVHGLEAAMLFLVDCAPEEMEAKVFIKLM
jgi:hypothetical protein